MRAEGRGGPQRPQRALSDLGDKFSVSASRFFTAVESSKYCCRSSSGGRQGAGGGGAQARQLVRLCPQTNAYLRIMIVGWRRRGSSKKPTARSDASSGHTRHLLCRHRAAREESGVRGASAARRKKTRGAKTHKWGKKRRTPGEKQNGSKQGRLGYKPR